MSGTDAVTSAAARAFAIDAPTATPPNAPPLAIAETFGVNVALSVTAPETEIVPVPTYTVAAGSPALSATALELATAPSPAMIPPANAWAVLDGASVLLAVMASEPPLAIGTDTYAAVAPSAVAVAVEEPIPTRPAPMSFVTATGAATEAATTEIGPAALIVPPPM
jgi:hypothetical protein